MKSFRFHIIILISIICYPLKTAGHDIASGVTRCVVIGISDYQDEGIPDLQFAHRDAEAFSNYLLYSSGDKVERENIQLITNEKATGGQVHKALNELLEVSKPNDRVIIYFAGHGDVETIDEKDSGHLLLYDTPANTYQINSLRVDDLKKIVGKLTVEIGAEVLLITDACRSGSLAGKAVSGAQVTTNALTQQFASETKILSCQADEYSIEGTQWGGGRGVFSLHLVEGLIGLADKDGDNQVTLRELQRYLEDNVEDAVAPNHQSPEVLGDKRKVISFVDHEAMVKLIKSKSSAAGYEEFSSVLENTVNIVRPELAEIRDQFYESLQQGYFISEDNRDGQYGDYKSASEWYDEMVSSNVSDIQLKGIKADLIAALQDDAQGAINSYLMSKNEEIIYNWSGTEYINYPKYMDKAAKLLGAQHYLYDQMMSKKYYFEAFYLRSTAAKAKDKYANYRLGEEKIKKALLYEDHAAHIFNELGLAYLHQNKDGAIEMYKKAIELSPNWAIPYTNVANAYHMGGNYESAEKYVNIAIQKDPSYLKAKSLLAGLLLNKNNIEAGKILLLGHLEEYGPSHYLFYSLGEFFTNAGDNKNAVKYLELALDSKEDFSTYVALGYAYYAIDIAEAKEYWDKALSINPKDVDVLNNLAWVNQVKGNFEEAIELYTKAIAQDANFLNARLNLGKIYFDQNQMTKAINEFQYLLESIDQEHAEAQFYMAKIVSLKGQGVEAVSYIKKAIDNGYIPLVPIEDEISFENIKDTDEFKKYHSLKEKKDE